jgi:hypothetical protein
MLEMFCFRSDPIEWITNNIENYDVVCASEGLLYKDEPWGRGNLIEGYPDLYESHKDNPIMNVGVIGEMQRKLQRFVLEYLKCARQTKHT